MSNGIVADGPTRFAETDEYRSRVRAIEQAVAARYSSRFAQAGFLRRLAIRYLRHRELQRELKKVLPSPLSCWFGVSNTEKEKKKTEDHGNALRNRIELTAASPSVFECELAVLASLVSRRR